MKGKFSLSGAASLRSRGWAMAIPMAMAVIASSVAAVPASAVPPPIAQYNLRMGDGNPGVLIIYANKTFFLGGRTMSTCTTTGSRNPETDPNGPRNQIKIVGILGKVIGRKLDVTQPGDGFYGLVRGRISRDGRKVSGRYLLQSTNSSPAHPEFGLGAYEQICTTSEHKHSFSGTRGRIR